MGFGNVIVRYTAKFRTEGKQAEQYEMFGMSFLLYIVIGLLVLLLGSLLYFNVNVIFEETMTMAELEKAQVMLLLLV